MIKKITTQSYVYNKKKPDEKFYSNCHTLFKIEHNQNEVPIIQSVNTNNCSKKLKPCCCLIKKFVLLKFLC